MRDGVAATRMTHVKVVGYKAVASQPILVHLPKLDFYKTFHLYRELQNEHFGLEVDSFRVRLSSLCSSKVS
jgi:hypothetical protein